MPAVINPWTETSHAVCDKVVADVYKMSAHFRATAPNTPNLQKDIENLAQALVRLGEIYRENPNAWRANRALSVVHLPELKSSLDGLAGLQDTTNPRYVNVQEDLRVCIRGLEQTIDQMSQNTYERFEIEAETLMQALGQTREKTPQSNSYFDYLTPTLSLTPHLKWAGRKMTAAQKIARHYAGSWVEDGLQIVARPITSRGRAAVNAALDIGVQSLLTGALITLIFPPAAPYVAGLVVLEAPDAYRKALEDERKALDKTDKARDQQRADALSQAKKELGIAPVVRLETPYVLVSINTQTGESEGIFLTGKHMGKSFQDVSKDDFQALKSFAPDEKTGQILASWQKGH